MSERQRAQPKRAAGHEDCDSSARKIQNDRCPDQDQRQDPDDPPFSSLAKIVLSAGKNYDRGEPEKSPGLIPIWKWTEILVVVPECERGVCEVKCDAGCDCNSGRIHFPCPLFLRTDVRLPDYQRMEPGP